MSFFRTEGGRYTADKQNALQLSTILVAMRSTLSGFIAWGSIKPGCACRRTQLAQIRFDDEESTWLALAVARISVDKNCRLVTFHQGVREVEAANSEVGDANSGRKNVIR